MIRMKNNHILVMCHNLYSFEGTETNKSWELEIIDDNNLLTNEIIEQLKNFSETIYFNDLTSKNWIFDFKINNVWFESKRINCNNMKMVLNAYN